MYTFISYDSNTRIAVIHVEGCSKQTQISIPSNVVQSSLEWDDLLSVTAQEVLDNMDPMSPNYDPSLL